MDFALARRHMVDCQIKPSKVTDKRIIEAFLAIPREDFFPADLKSICYLDEDLEVREGVYMLEPAVFARMLQAAGINENDVVLEVGCASGYSTAIVSQLARSVVSIEANEELAAFATDYLSASDHYCNAAVFCGDLRRGYPEQGPYDLIIVNGGVANVPACLLDQLAQDGRLIAVVSDSPLKTGKATLFQKTGSTITRKDLFDVNIPYLKGFEPQPGFTF